MKPKKLLSFVVASLMAISILPVFTPTVSAAETGYEIGDDRSYDFVYYGHYETDENIPIKWRLLDTDYRYDKDDTSKTGMLLLSEYPLGNIMFGYDIDWDESIAKVWCGEMYESSFGTEEKALILQTNSDNILYDDHLFFLSKDEADTYFPYFPSRVARYSDELYAYWWLRSFNGGILCVCSDGRIREFKPDDDGIAARPAFTLDSSKIIFKSAAIGGKPINVGTLSKINENTTGEYKLTVKDDAHSDFTVKDLGNEVATAITKSVSKGETVSLGYENAVTGENEYVSAMIAKDEETLYYGQLAKATDTKGEVKFRVPLDIDAGTYELRLFNEQINDDCKTDFASNFAVVTLKVENAYEIYNLEELEYFRNMVNSGETDICGKLINDIIVNPGTFADDGSYTSADGESLRAWTPIGVEKNEVRIDGDTISSETVTYSYTGTFDGNGKTISGLYFNDSGSDYAGLFGLVGGSATIKNITVKNSYFNGGNCVGGIVGYAKPGQVEQDDSEFAVIKTKGNVSLINCRSEATVGGTGNVGGIIGSAGAANGAAVAVEQCANMGKVKGENNVGGIVGSADVSSVTTSKVIKTPVISSSGEITITENIEIVPDGSAISVSDCYNTAAVNGNGSVGGIVGYAYLKYSGSLTFGGFIGGTPTDGIKEVIVSRCFNIGTVTGTENTGSISGYAVYEPAVMVTIKQPSLTTITDCYYQSDTADTGMGYGTDTTVAKDTEAFASGEVAYLLQGNGATSVWGQNIEVEKIPVLNGKRVYKYANNIYSNELYNEFEIIGVITENNLTKTSVYIPKSGTYTLIFAKYDGKKLSAVTNVPVTVSTDGEIVMSNNTLAFTLAAGDKIMLWADFENIVPLCEAYEIK